MAGDGIKLTGATSREGGVHARDATGAGIEMTDVDASGDVTANVEVRGVPDDPPPGASVTVSNVTAGRDIYAVAGDLHIVHAAPIEPLPPLPPPPPPPDRFVGRDAELARLAELLSPPALMPVPDRPTLARAAIRGIGGVGKTALALHFANRYRASFPGGILFGYIGTERDAGERGAPMNPEEVLRTTLLQWEAELGRVADPARATAAILGSARALLATRTHRIGRCLIVLDNVDTAATLDPLLEALPDCAVLLTTRQAQLADVDGTSVIDLGGLERVASLGYVAAELGAGDPRLGDVAGVLQHVEDHPLAVKLIVSALKASPGLTPADALAHLRSSPTRRAKAVAGLRHVPQSLQDCFRVSVAALPRARVPLLISMASQSPLSCPIEAIDYVSGICNLDRTSEGLAELHAAGLVEPAGEGRFRIHRLLKDYLREVPGREGFGFIPPTWEVAALARLLVHVAPGLSAGQTVYDRRQEDWHLDFASRNAGDDEALRREWDGIVMGISRAGRSPAGGERLLAFEGFLRGADFSKLKVQKSILDDVCLDRASFEDADLSGGPLRRLGYRRRIPWSLLPTCLFASAWLLSVNWRAAAPWIPMFPFLAYVQLVVEGGRWLDRLDRRRRILLENLAFGVAYVTASLPSIWELYADIPNPWARLLLVAEIVGPAYPLVFIGQMIVSTLVARVMSWRRARRGLGGRLIKALIYVCGVLAPSIVHAWLLNHIDVHHRDWTLAERVLNVGGPFALCALVGGFIQNPETGNRLWSVQATYLRRASLRWANLKKAKLAWVRLDGATLEGADLTGADLRHARLTGADLSNADLRQVDLRGADLSRADLTGARLVGAIHDATTHWPEGFVPPPMIVASAVASARRP